MSIFMSIIFFKSKIQKYFLQRRAEIYYRQVNSKSSQPAFICSKLTIETLVQGVKYVQS